MQNKKFKDILCLQVTQVELAKRPSKGNNDEPIHYGVILTINNSQEQYLLHNGYKFGIDQDFVLTSRLNTSKDWQIFESIILGHPIKLEILFLAGCCGQNLRYHPQYNNSKHALDRILSKVNELNIQN